MNLNIWASIKSAIKAAFSPYQAATRLIQKADWLSLQEKFSKADDATKQQIRQAIDDHLPGKIINGNIENIWRAKDVFTDAETLKLFSDSIEKSLPQILEKKDYSRFNQLYAACTDDAILTKPFNDFMLLKAARAMLENNCPGDYFVLKQMKNNMSELLRQRFERLESGLNLTVRALEYSHVDVARRKNTPSIIPLAIMFTEKGVICQDPRFGHGRSPLALTKLWRGTVSKDANQLTENLHNMLIEQAARGINGAHEAALLIINHDHS